MARQRIRLTESQLHNIIRRCVNEAVNESKINKLSFDISISDLGIYHNGRLVYGVYKKKNWEDAYLETLMNDGLHIIGKLSELPQDDYRKIMDMIQLKMSR